MRLNLGCGHAPRRPGIVGMDNRALPTVDVVHDCEVLPWPFKDGTFEQITSWHLFEHLKPWLMIDIMNECWRVMAPEGTLKIGMPMAGSFGFFQDPTHIRTWNEATPQYFDPDYKYYQWYTPKPWKIELNTSYLKEPPKRLIYTEPTAFNGSLQIVLRKRPDG